MNLSTSNIRLDLVVRQIYNSCILFGAGLLFLLLISKLQYSIKQLDKHLRYHKYWYPNLYYYIFFCK